MDEKMTDLDLKVSQPIIDTISGQVQESFNKIVETDKWLTQHNFLVNAGGAAAILGYMGGSSTPNHAIFPLVIFLVGIIASGIEIRGLLGIYGHLHKDALRRRGGFMSDQITVKEAASVEPIPTKYTNANNWSGYVAQGSFIIGCATGVIGFYCNQL